jgi:hypothetical protein
MTPSLQRLAKGTAENVVVRSDGVLWRLAEYLPFLGHLVARRERALARAQCTLMLEVHRTVQIESPGLTGEALYQRVVAKRLSCGERRARELVRLADQSFAQWPEARDVNFRDVVTYVIVNQIMVAHARAMGTQSDVEKIVNAAIPEGL